MMGCIKACWHANSCLGMTSIWPVPTLDCVKALSVAVASCLLQLPLPVAFACCLCLLYFACLCAQGILPPDELSDLAQSPHPPNYVLGMLSELVASTCFSSPVRYRMEQNLTFFHDCHGKCERILGTPIPLSYTR